MTGRPANTGRSGEGQGDGPAEPDRAGPEARSTGGLGFRARLTLGLLAAAVIPLTGFGVVVLVLEGPVGQDATVPRVLLLAIAVSVIFAVLLAAVIASDLGAPLRAIARSVERVSAGDLDTPLELPGDDEMTRLAERHNRLARDLARRGDELRRILDTLGAFRVDDGPAVIATRAAAAAKDVFGMVDCSVLLVDPREIPTVEPVPGEQVPVRVVMHAAGEQIGVVAGTLPATRTWERADQDLFELFVIEVAGAVRTAQLFARVETQNRRLRELDEAKDDFLRGVSHNLQTPLASIRGYAAQLEADRPDPRLGIITEQADRLSRMVRQLLLVSRLESGALRSRQEVFAVAPRVRRTWEALAAGDVEFSLQDGAAGWLAVGDPDQLDQVLWALLDNSVNYGGRTPIRVEVSVATDTATAAISITDHGAGVADADRSRLFTRYERGAGRPSGEGSGLGLFVARGLCRAMGGDLVLEPRRAGEGATFTITLPAEAPDES